MAVAKTTTAKEPAKKIDFNEVVFNQPFTYTENGEEKTIKSVTVDFLKLTVDDLNAAENDARMDGEMNPMLQFSGKYKAAILARLMGVSYEQIKRMNAKDYLLAEKRVAAFLI